MANWCENDLRVEGPIAAIDEFLKFAAGESPFDFNRFIPYPEEFQRWTMRPRLGTRSTRSSLIAIGASGRKTALIPAAMSGASSTGVRSGPRFTSIPKGR